METEAAAFLAAFMVCSSIPQITPVIPGIIVAEAHSGRTDSRGGHKDNKNKSGLGSYHYHCGGYSAHLHDNGICPYSTAASVSIEEPETKTVPENISLVFSAAYYAEHNADLYEAFGYDADKLLEHFLTSGMKEGRVAAEGFNVAVYKERNADLIQVYGDDTAAYYEHYMNCGHAEGRTCH